MGLHVFPDVEDMLVDLFHLGDLDHLVDGLFDGGARVVGDLPCVDGVAVERQVRDEVEGRRLRVDVDVIVDLVGHLGHLGAGRDALAADQQFRPVDVDDLVDPGRRPSEEALDHRAEQRLVGRDQRVLSGLVDVEDRSARLQHAEMIALDREQRARHDAVVDDLDRDVLAAQQIRSITAERGNDLTRDRHSKCPPDPGCQP